MMIDNEFEGMSAECFGDARRIAGIDGNPMRFQVAFRQRALGNAIQKRSEGFGNFIRTQCKCRQMKIVQVTR